jgi:hypothetical protein
MSSARDKAADLRAALLWTVESRSPAITARRSLAFVSAMLGPEALGAASFTELSALRGEDERTQRRYRGELKLSFGIVPPVSNLSAPKSADFPYEDEAA